MDIEDDLIFPGDSLPVRAIPVAGSYPAKDWVEQLQPRDFKRAQAGARSADVAAASGRGYAGRIEKISGSSVGLMELRLTRGGTKGPQLRLLGVLLRGAFWAAHGFAKKNPRFAGDIATAEVRVHNWIEESEGDRRPASGPEAKAGKKGRGRRPRS
jgi:hypothetical protein